MDWVKLFAFLVAVTSIGITAEVPLKKIRIHLPQKVKHIHHHKKIYITNHPASSQYAPAYGPGSEGAEAMASNAIIPAVPNYSHIDSIEHYEGLHARQSPNAGSSSKMLPLYRARGYYGPNPSEWDVGEQYDINTSAEPTDSFTPTGFESATVAPISSYHHSKKAKVVKAKEPPRKKMIPKNKPKQVLIRGKPLQEEEHPVSSFHEQFYSDLHGLGTIRKIKKPQRVEKIIDGDTEHIHTYSEEHIHKLVFDDGAKITGMPADDPISGIPLLSASRPTKHVKNSQTLLALPSNPFTGFAYGPMETPANLEYAAYNPHEVTHDHIFHDHGEIPPDVDVIKDPLLYPPRVSYNSKGVRIGVGPVNTKLKYSNNYIKSMKTTPDTDFNYQENLPYQYTKTENPYKNINTYYDPTPQKTFDDFRPVPYFNYRVKDSLKSTSLVPSSYFDSERTQQTSVPTPFAVSSTIIHDYTPKSYGGRATGSAGYSKFKDPLLNFKDSYTNNLEYDTYAAPSNFYPTTGKNEEIVPFQGRKGKQKSLSRQNINFLGLDHKTSVDHQDFYDGGFSSISYNEDSLKGLDFNNEYEAKPPDVISSTPSTVKESSSAYSYYSAMAIKALHDEQQQQEEEQSSSTTPYTPPAEFKTSLSSEHYGVLNVDTVSTPSPNFLAERKQRPKHPKNNVLSNVHHDPINYNGASRDIGKSTKETHTSRYLYRQPDVSTSPSSRLKYGDKLN